MLCSVLRFHCCLWGATNPARGYIAMHCPASLSCCCDVLGACPTAVFQGNAVMCPCLPPELVFPAFPAAAFQPAGKKEPSSDLGTLGIRASETLDGSKGCMNFLGFGC